MWLCVFVYWSCLGDTILYLLRLTFQDLIHLRFFGEQSLLIRTENSIRDAHNPRILAIEYREYSSTLKSSIKAVMNQSTRNNKDAPFLKNLLEPLIVGVNEPNNGSSFTHKQDLRSTGVSVW